MWSVQMRGTRFLEFLNFIFYSQKSLFISAQTRRPPLSYRTGHVVPSMHMHSVPGHAIPNERSLSLEPCETIGQLSRVQT